MKVNKLIAFVLISMLITVIMPMGVFAAGNPPALILTLASDTGIPDDHITSDGTMNVGNIQPGATWEYSINGGTSWNSGSGATFVLPDGTYNSGSLQVRQTLNGNTSDVTSNTSTIIISENQVTNGDFQLGDTGFSSDYTYSTTPDIGEAIYSIVTDARDVHSQWVSSYDHTYGNASGKYFVGNGSSDTTAEVWKSNAIQVEAGMAYRFESYICSVYAIGANDAPSLRFELGDGVNWAQMGTTYSFNPDSGWTDVGIWHLSYADGKFTNSGTYYIRLRNLQSAATGNDFGLDDVYFSLRGAAPSSSDPGTNPDVDPPTFDTSSFLSLSLHSDTGKSDTDKITSNGQVDVTGLQYAWEYSINGGSTWITGSGSSFTLSGDGSKSAIVHQRNSENTAWLDASAPLDFTLDSTPPLFNSAVVNDKTLTLTYDENLDTDNPPSITDFAVTVNGGLPVVLSALNVSGSIITITLARSVYNGQTIMVSYTTPSGNNATKDVAGNKAVNINGYAVPNNTITVSYHANGATSGRAPSPQNKVSGVDLTIANNYGSMAKTGYAFSGWNTAADGTGTYYAEGAVYATDTSLILYAIWIENANTQIGQSNNHDSSSNEIYVPTKPNIIVLGASVQSNTVISGQPVTIFANVANRGDTEGEFTATLKINGEVVESKTGRLAGNTGGHLDFTVYRTQPGTYNVDVNGQETYFTVPRNANTNTSRSNQNLVLILGGALIIIVISILIALIVRRKRDLY